MAYLRMKFSCTFLVCILDLIQPISTALSTASYPSGVDTLFIVSRTVFWIAFPSEKKIVAMMLMLKVRNSCLHTFKCT